MSTSNTAEHCGFPIEASPENTFQLALRRRDERKLPVDETIPLLFFYATETGLHASSVRAATMAWILIGGLFFERKVLPANSLAAAAFLSSAGTQTSCFPPGSNFSFAVVGAIVLFGHPFFKVLRRRAATDPFLPQSLQRGPLSNGLEPPKSDSRERSTLRRPFRLGSVPRCGAAAIGHRHFNAVSGTRTDQR